MELAIGASALAVQIAVEAEKLKNFWGSIKDAPDATRSSLEDLSLVTGLVAKISRLEQENQDPNPELQIALEKTLRKTQELTSFMHVLENGLDSENNMARKWAGLRIARKGEMLEQMRKRLEEIKSTLILALSLCGRKIQAEQSSKAEAVSKTVEQLSRKVDVTTAETKEQIESLRAEVTSLRNESIRSRVQDMDDLKEHFDRLGTMVRDMAEKMTNPLCSAPFQAAVSQVLQELPSSAPASELANQVKSHQAQGFDEKETESARPAEPGRDQSVYYQSNSSRTNDYCNEARPGVSYRGTRKRVRRWYRYHTRTFFGHLVFTTRSVEWPACRKIEVITSVTIAPALWLSRLGLKYAFELSLVHSRSGCYRKIEPFRIRPNDSMIFQMCMKGNLQGVRTLLSVGEASIKDISPQGYTLLHIATLGGNFELSKFLVDVGVPRYQENWYSQTPAHLVIFYPPDIKGPGKHRGWLNLFEAENLSFELTGDGWIIFEVLCHHFPSSAGMLLQLIREIERQGDYQVPRVLEVLALIAINRPVCAKSARAEAETLVAELFRWAISPDSLLFQALHRPKLEIPWLITFCLRHGASPHFRGLSNMTIFYVSLWEPYRFSLFLREIKDYMVQGDFKSAPATPSHWIDDFIEAELFAGSMLEAQGWQKTSLWLLMEHADTLAEPWLTEGWIGPETCCFKIEWNGNICKRKCKNNWYKHVPNVIPVWEVVKEAVRTSSPEALPGVLANFQFYSSTTATDKERSDGPHDPGDQEDIEMIRYPLRYSLYMDQAYLLRNISLSFNSMSCHAVSREKALRHYDLFCKAFMNDACCFYCITYLDETFSGQHPPPPKDLSFVVEKVGEEEEDHEPRMPGSFVD